MRIPRWKTNPHRQQIDSPSSSSSISTNGNRNEIKATCSSSCSSSNKKISISRKRKQKCSKKLLIIMEEKSLLEDIGNLQYYSSNDRQFYDCSVKLTRSHLQIQIHTQATNIHRQGEPTDETLGQSARSTGDHLLLIPLNYLINCYSLDEVITDWGQLYRSKFNNAIIITNEPDEASTNNRDSCESITDAESADSAGPGQSESESNNDTTKRLSKTNDTSSDGAEFSAANNSSQEASIHPGFSDYLYISIYWPFDQHTSPHTGTQANHRLNKGSNVIILSFKKTEITRDSTTRNKNSLNYYEHDDAKEHQNNDNLTSTNGANQWVDAIMSTAVGSSSVEKPGLMEVISKWISSIPKDNKNNTNKRILIMINPFGGQGKAMRIFRKKVLPMLVDGNADFELFITKRANDAKDFLHNQENIANRWKSIVVLSGDGLFYEVINGLMLRTDWQQCMTVPLGIIPAGSGNGLAYSLIHKDYPDIPERDSVALSTLNVIRGETSEADLVRVTTSKETYWSFLSVCWGLLADIDIESERFRIIGEFRFTIWSILRAINLRTYRGRLSYQPVSKEGNCNDKTHGDDDEDDGTVLESDQKDDTNDDWIEVEADFVCVFGAYQTHLSSDLHMVPNSKLDDGAIALSYLTGKLSSSQIINFLIAIKTGAHVSLPYVTSVQVKSFKLEPLVKSIITVDGEAIPWQDGPIEVEVVPTLARFLCKQTPNM